ncbi:MAG: protein BatD [Magnetococcales bacterium]|nr:protein BatD [Magnetococcales bacterium]
MVTRFFPLWLCVALLLLPGTAWSAGVTARVDRHRIPEGETFTLMLESTGQTGDVSGLDLTPLEQDFQVVGRSSGSSFSNINGAITAKTTLTLSLLPLRSGRLVVPALVIDGLATAPIDIEVLPPGSASPGGGRDYFLEAQVDQPNPLVQSQVILTVRFFRSVAFSQGAITGPEETGLLVERLGEDRQLRLDRDGRSYDVIERRYALFPQRSGILKIPGIGFQGERVVQSRSPGRVDPFANDPFFEQFLGGNPLHRMLGQSAPVRLRAPEITLQVAPRPAGLQDPWWLPARQVTLSAEGWPQTGRGAVGEPLTLTLGIHATGVTGAQLPELPKPTLDGARLYPDQPKVTTRPVGDWMVGERFEKWAIIPTRPGTLTLPAIDVPWWDVIANQRRVARLPALTLEVAAGTAPAADQPAAASAPAVPHAVPATASPDPSALPPAAAAPVPVPEAGYWPMLTGIVLTGWLATLLLWWRRFRSESRPSASPSPAPRPRVALDRLRAAWADVDPAGLQKTLLAWGAATWPDSPPATLEALTARLPGAAVAALLAELNRALYGGGTWSPGDRWPVLEQALQQVRPPDRSHHPMPPLPPLNPPVDAVLGVRDRER